MDGLSFDVDPARLLHRRGIGLWKTTLGARAAARPGQAHSGNISIFGLDPSRLRGEELRKFLRQVQVIFQDPMGLSNPRQSVYEAVAEGAHPRVAGDEKRSWPRP